MKLARALCLILCAVAVGAADGPAAAASGKLLEVELEDYGWEADMGALDRLSGEMQTRADSVGYVILYGGRRNVAGELRRRIACMETYLVSRRGLSEGRVKFVEGGYRERRTMEMWVLGPGERPPRPTPTLSRRQVRVRKGEIKYTCEV